MSASSKPQTKTILDGTDVGPIGFGLMGFTWSPTPKSVDEAVDLLEHAYKQGARLWNAGEFYGPPDHNSLQLLKAYFTKHPDHIGKVRVSIKGAIDSKTLQPKPDEAGIQESIRFCKSVLGDVPLDIYEVARFHPDIPVEDTLHALNKAYKAGQIKGVSLSEASASTIELAHKILGDALKTVEVELSLFTLDPLQNGVAATCKKYGLPLTAYSPLGRGFLAGKYKTEDELPPFLKTIPRFQGEAFKLNLQMVDEVKRIADAKGYTPGQVALGWVISQSNRGDNPTIIPIPGATSHSRIDENLSPVYLTEQELSEIDGVLSRIPVVGGRYSEADSKFLTI